MLDGPGVHDDGVGLLVEEDAVENVEGVDGDDAGDESFLGLAVKGLGGEAAGVDFTAFFHKLGEALVDEEVTGEGFFAKGGKATLEAHGDAGSVEEDGGFVAFSQETGGGEGVDDGNGSFEGDGVKGDEGLFSFIGLYVFKDFFFVINEVVPVLVHWFVDFWHLFFGLIVSSAWVQKTSQRKGVEHRLGQGGFWDECLMEEFMHIVAHGNCFEVSCEKSGYDGRSGGEGGSFGFDGLACFA